MTTQQENYIESKLEEFYNKRRDEYLIYVENEITDIVEREEEKEAEKCEGKLFGAALEAHLKSFAKAKEDAYYKEYMEKFEEDISKELEEYRKKLEAEC